MQKRFVQRGDGRTVFVTIDGDVVDQIAHAFYGRHAGMSELVLEANPGLADRGSILPAGIVVVVPSAPLTPPVPAFRRLWE